jgi:hypothetical protein
MPGPKIKMTAMRTAKTPRKHQAIKFGQAEGHKLDEVIFLPLAMSSVRQ